MNRLLPRTRATVYCLDVTRVELVARKGVVVARRTDVGQDTPT
jgi:hypothetical protein